MHANRKWAIVVALALLLFMADFMDSLQGIVVIQTFEIPREM
jgi:hypothetical protein